MPEAVFRRSAASGLTPMARWLAAILACMPLALRAAPLELPAPRNLQQEAVEMARSDKPMVVLYSQSGCHWCEEARTYLVPMSREAGSRDAALYRQIDLDSDAPLVDFQGRRGTQRSFAERERVRFTPTVVVYGPRGERLAEPIVGMRLADFYGQYLEQAIATARERLNAVPR